MVKYLKTLRAIRQMVNRGIVPGISYAILDGNQVKTGQYGNRELIPERLPLSNHNYSYDLASLTKVVGTVPVILKLAEERRLKISDSIRKYLPEWNYPQVTVRHLLTHTSGICGWIPHRNQLPPHRMLRAMLNDLHVGPAFDRKMVYSDTNFVFLGLIAERIAGQPIHRLISKMVLQPLGMHESTFRPRDRERCVPTEITPSLGLLQGTADDPKARILGDQCGSAGLFSTIGDLIKFCQGILDPVHHPAVLSPEMTKQLFIDHTKNGRLGRSYGWAMRTVPHSYIYQSGYTGTGIAVQPARHRALIFLSNRVHPKRPNIPFLAWRKWVVRTFIGEK